jgi:hypothetical protein
MNLGAFFAAANLERRKKPGFTLVSFAQHPYRAKGYRFNPLRGSISRTTSFVGTYPPFTNAGRK